MIDLAMINLLLEVEAAFTACPEQEEAEEAFVEEVETEALHAMGIG